MPILDYCESKKKINTHRERDRVYSSSELKNCLSQQGELGTVISLYTPIFKTFGKIARL